MENTEKKKEPVLVKIFGVIISTVLIACVALDGYTYLMGRVHTVCGFDGAYSVQYEEENTTIVYIFDKHEMVTYFITDTEACRVSYEYEGMYYNKGLFGRFLDFDDTWVKIPNAEKAGEFYADCKSSVVTSFWGDVVYLDEDEIEQLEEEEGTRYSLNYNFEVSGDSLTLIAKVGEEYAAIPLTKTHVLTGHVGDEIEHLDYLWNNNFNE